MIFFLPHSICFQVHSLFIGVDASFTIAASSTRDKLTSLENTEVSSVSVTTNCQSTEKCTDLPRYPKSKHTDHRMNRAI